MDFITKENVKIKNNKQVTHCIFDMDGLLLDTEPILEGILTDIAKMYGKPYTHDVRMRVLGTTEQLMAKIAVTELDLPITAIEFRRLFTDFCRQRFTNLKLMDGAERLLRHLHKHGILIALGTSSSMEMAELKMTNHEELFDLFHHKVMGSTDVDVIHGKPAPDIFIVAGKRFPIPPKPANCLVFEDAPNGVRAACLAGMPSVLVPDEIVAPELRREATAVIRSLLDFKPEKFGLPAFDDHDIDDDMLVNLGTRSMPTGSNDNLRIENNKPITHCLFDMDGLLLDTEPILEGILHDIAHLFGREFTHEVRMKVLGTTEQLMAEIAVTEMDLPITTVAFRRLFTDLCRHRFSNLSVMEGAERLIRHLHKHRIPFALATSSSKEMAEVKMAKHRKLFDLFHHKVMGSTDVDVKNGKPAPDIFLVAGNRFPDKPKRENCLVFEDAPNGVRAACLAGMPSVLVPDDIVASELRREATVVLQSLSDFKPEQFGLPPFDDDSSNSSDSESGSENYTVRTEFIFY